MFQQIFLHMLEVPSENVKNNILLKCLHSGLQNLCHVGTEIVVKKHD